MPKFRITAPDGKQYEITGETAEGAKAALDQQLSAQAPTPPAPEGGAWDKFRQTTFGENVIGYGEADTPGEKVGQYVRGTTAAVARGIADVPALPANLLQLVALGVEKATGMDGSMVSRGLNALPDTRDMLSSVPVIGQESEYKAPGKIGEFLSTGGEFAGGSGLMMGPKAIMKYGFAPGIASEGAGQATEGTALEPYARTAAALATSVGLSALTKPKAFTSTVPGADPIRVGQANVLTERGVSPSVGQATGSELLRKAEGSLQATGRQLDDFSAAAMKTIGSPSTRATPEALVAAEKAIVKSMDDAVQGVNVIPSPQNALDAAKVAADYVQRVPAGLLTPRVRGIAEEIARVAKSKTEIPLSQIKEWRSDIGRFTVSPDAATREAGHALRATLDDITDTALRMSGKADNIANLSAARTKYQNYLAIRDVASRSGSGSAVGIVSPQRLQSAVTRIQGRSKYAKGQGTDLADLARSGSAVLDSAPTVAPGAARNISQLTPGLLGGLGYLTGGLPAAIALAAAPKIGRGALLSGPMQRMLASPGSALMDATKGMAGMSPGLIQGTQK